MALAYKRPNRALLRELGQVALRSDQLRLTIENLNEEIPEDFPIESLTDLCITLSGLKDGTAENCRIPLQLGRDMLPKIRREHFHIEGEELPDGIEAVFYRDMMLDQQIGHLSFAVQTALDEYKAQLQEQFDDDVRAEELGILPEGESTESLSAQIDNLNQTVGDTTRKLDDHELGQTPEGDTLSRRMTDSANLSHAARAQIRQRPIVRRWLDATAEALSKAPVLIERAGNALETVARASKPLTEWFLDLKKDAILSLIDQAGKLGVAISQTGKRLQRPPSNAERETIARQRDPATIDAEAKVRQMLIDGVKPPRHLAEQVVRLRLTGSPNNIRHIPNWRDLELCKNLEELFVGFTTFNPAESAPIARALQRLWKLVISDIHDLRGLEHFQNLTSLSVQSGQITSVDALAGLTGLTSLNLQGNQITSIDALAGLTNLTSLNVQCNQITSIDALAGLISLTSLSVQCNQITSIDALSGLIGLTSLSVQGGQFTNINALADLTGLTSLTVYGSQITSIDAIADLWRLTSLTVYGQFASIDALAGLTRLTSLSVQGGQITSIDAIAGLTRLTSLSVQGGQFTSIDAIAKLINLEKFSISQVENQIDFAVLAEHPNLKSLTLSSVNALNIKKIQDVDGLEIKITA